MKPKITLDVETYPWSCECCGSGYHIKIHIPELNKTFSENDQFGGKLDGNHDDWPENVHRGYYAVDELTAYYEKKGCEVTVK